jgi:hypothetical protein
LEKVTTIAQRSEYAVKPDMLCKVDGAFGAILKAEKQPVAIERTDFDDIFEHTRYS